MHPVILLILVVGVLLLVSWVKRQPPQKRQQIGFKAALVAGGGLLLFGLLTGRLNPLFALAAAALPLAQRLLAAKQLFDRFKSAQGPSAGKQSTISTQFFDMKLDHDSGEMAGTVRAGRYAGRTLAELSLQELLELLDECHAEDPQSASVLEAYLDRQRGPAWRNEPGADRGSARASPDAGAMTVQEARDILGLGAEASRKEIVAAHRSLMQKLHPDRGGSTYLAAKVNQAKELLLENL